MNASPSATAERLAREKREKREREDADLAVREGVLRGEITLETYLTFYRGYSDEFLSKTLRPH